MAQNRETRLTLSGLVTQPNKFLAEPGSLAVAENVMCRQPGVIEPRIAFDEIGDTEQTPRAIYQPQIQNSETIVSADPDATEETRLNFSYRIGDGIVQSITNENISGGSFCTRGAVSEMRERVFMDQIGDDGLSIPQLVRAIDPGSSGLVARRGGMIPPSWIDTASGPAGDAVGVDKWVGYRAHFERQHADGYIQIGPVSPICLFHSLAAQQVELVIYWSQIVTDNDWVRAGDLLRVYRTDNADTRDAVGDTLRLAATIELDASDVSAFLASVIDISTDDGLTDFLYANSGQGGSDESKWFPPSASDMVQFRNVMWYVTPFALREFQLRVPGKWGHFASGADGRAEGVGSFSVSTTATLGLTTFTVSAGDLIGLSIGMRVLQDTSGNWAPGTRVTDIVGTTVTMQSNALVGGAATFILGDVMVINGTEYQAYSPSHLMYAISQAAQASTDEDFYPAWVFSSVPLERTSYLVVETPVEGVDLTFIAPSYSRDFAHTLSTCAVNATNGDRFSPPLPIPELAPAVLGSDDPRKNRGHFSEIDEPEAVPVLNYRFFGHGTLYKLIAVEDVLLAFCSDGTYVCTGDGENWDIRDLDRALKLLHRNAVDVLEGTVWALTNRGVVAISGGQVQEVSTPFIGDRIRELEEQFAASFEPVAEGLCLYNVILKCDPTHKEVWVRWRDDTGDGVTLVFNVVTKTWTEISDVTESPTALGYDPARRSILIGREKPQGSSIQTLRSSLPDTSPAPSSRMEAPSIQLNPFSAGDLNTKKQFLEVVYDLELAEGELEILPNFGELEYPAAYDVIGTGDDMEHVVKVPRNAANGKSLSPGFSITGTADLATAPVWKLSGVTVKFRVASPDTRRQ